MNKCCSLLNTIYLHSKTLKCVRKLEVCLTLVNNLKKKQKKNNEHYPAKESRGSCSPSQLTDG